VKSITLRRVRAEQPDTWPSFHRSTPSARLFGVRPGLAELLGPLLRVECVEDIVEEFPAILELGLDRAQARKWVQVHGVFLRFTDSETLDAPVPIRVFREAPRLRCFFDLLLTFISASSRYLRPGRHVAVATDRENLMDSAEDILHETQIQLTQIADAMDDADRS
jgi:hypothetical protein